MDVARKSSRIFGADREESALFEDFAGEKKGVGGVVGCGVNALSLRRVILARERRDECSE
jgi:hypothetical protein